MTVASIELWIQRGPRGRRAIVQVSEDSIQTPKFNRVAERRALALTLTSVRVGTPGIVNDQ